MTQKKSHFWTYKLQGAFASDPVGPLPEAKLASLAKGGQIKKNTLVASPTRTKGQWVEARKFPPLAKMIEEAAKPNEVAVVEAVPVESPTSNEVVPAQVVEASAAQSEEDLGSAKQKITDHLSQLLMTGEKIEFVCLQSRTRLVKRDALVSTNMRFIIAKPKILGRFELIDCMWIDLYDAHIKEGVLGSTFSIASNKGRYQIEHLSKVDARRIYQIAQDREQAVRWQRRQLEMEEKAAGAMQVNVNQPAIAATPVAQPAADDPMAKLAKLKQMLDAGLIEQAEYDETKARILQSM